MLGRAPTAGRGPAGRQAGRRHLPRRRRPGSAASVGVQDGPRRHARPVRDRAADRPARRAPPGCSATCSSLPKTYRATARLGWRSTTGDPRRRADRDGARPGAAARAADRRRHAAGADDLGRQGRRRASLPEGAARRAGRAPRRAMSTIHRADLIGRRRGRATFEIECSSGTYVRTLIEDARRRLLRGAATDGDRPPVAGSRIRRRGGRDPADRRAPRSSAGARLDPESERLVRNGIRIEAPDEATPDRAGRSASSAITGSSPSPGRSTDAWSPRWSCRDRGPARRRRRD